MAMTSLCQKSICIYQDSRNKGFMFAIKEVSKHAAQKINFLASAVANGRSLPFWKVSLGSDQVLMSHYLFIFDFAALSNSGIKKHFICTLKKAQKPITIDLIFEKQIKTKKVHKHTKHTCSTIQKYCQRILELTSEI